MTNPRQCQVNLSRAKLNYYEWHPELKGSQPTLLLVHATGFHARVWDQMIEQLPPMHIISVDQRGHGQSRGELAQGWADYSEDLLEFVRAIELTHAVAVGHSMGGHALVNVLAQEPQRFHSAVLIDPVILDPAIYEMLKDKPVGDHPTSKRRHEFDSVQAMVDRFSDKAPYSLFTSAALKDYCQYGLRENEAGDGMILCCTPETEAHIHASAGAHADILNQVKAVKIPVLILRAMVAKEGLTANFAYSPTWPTLADDFAQGQDMHLDHLTHFMPMQAPEEIANIVLQKITAVAD